MVRLEWLFLMQLAMGILMIVFLQKLIQMKKQVEEITKEVMNYISYVTEDIEEELAESAREDKKVSVEKRSGKRLSQKEKEEAQNRLIQAVLGEYFP
ncbi:MAG: hypothetical protein IJ455_04440 [Agathobacter sp.]|nr:hypothetical protein [Agathobacter sp.]